MHPPALGAQVQARPAPRRSRSRRSWRGRHGCPGCAQSTVRTDTQPPALPVTGDIRPDRSPWWPAPAHRTSCAGRTPPRRAATPPCSAGERRRSAHQPRSRRPIVTDRRRGATHPRRGGRGPEERTGATRPGRTEASERQERRRGPAQGSTGWSIVHSRCSTGRFACAGHRRSAGIRQVDTGRPAAWPSWSPAARCGGRGRHGRLPHRPPGPRAARSDRDEGCAGDLRRAGLPPPVAADPDREQETVYAPEFDRRIEDSLAHVAEISPAVGLVMVEGNYLLLASPPWDGVRPLLDQAWFVHLADDERRRRMVLRHESTGTDHADAVARTFGSDERNAMLVNAAWSRPTSGSSTPSTPEAVLSPEGTSRRTPPSCPCAEPH